MSRHGARCLPHGRIMCLSTGGSAAAFPGGAGESSPAAGAREPPRARGPQASAHREKAPNGALRRLRRETSRNRMIASGAVREAQRRPDTPRRPLSETLKRLLTCTFIVNVR